MIQFEFVPHKNMEINFKSIDFTLLENTPRIEISFTNHSHSSILFYLSCGFITFSEDCLALTFEGENLHDFLYNIHIVMVLMWHNLY